MLRVGFSVVCSTQVSLNWVKRYAKDPSCRVKLIDPAPCDSVHVHVGIHGFLQYKSKETPQLIGLFSPNLVITNFMQCFLYGPIG